MNSTKKNIIIAAEQLFAEQSFAAVSIRDIVKLANVNIAAINYHFGSKDELIFELVKSKVQKVNHDRFDFLSKVKKNKEFTLKDVISAFVLPPFELAKDSNNSAHFMRLVGQINSGLNPELKQRLYNEFEPIIKTFTEEIEKLLPDTPETKIRINFYFAVGSFAHTMLNSTFTPTFAKSINEDLSIDELAEYLIDFIVAGIAHA